MQATKKATYYRMAKYKWCDRTQGYDDIEQESGELTLSQVKERVANLPSGEVCLWSITLWEKNEYGDDVIGQINAECFEDDVPLF